MTERKPYHLFSLMPDGEYVYVGSVTDLNALADMIERSPSLVYLAW